MNLKFFAVLTVFVSHTVSSNTTLTDDQILNKGKQLFSIPSGNKITHYLFSIPSGNEITRYLANEDLKNMAKIGLLPDDAINELDNRFKILHYVDGKLSPVSVRENWKRISQMCFTDYTQCFDFADHHWSPKQAFFFGGENPLSMTGISRRCSILVVISQENSLKIQEKLRAGNEPLFIPAEIKGSPMNGLIIPWIPSSLDIDFCSTKIAEIYNNDVSNTYHEMKDKGQVKLAIIICGDNQVTKEKAANRAFMAAKVIWDDLGSIPICIVAQSDLKNLKRKLGDQEDSSVIFFQGSDTHVSIFVVDTRDDETMKRKLQNWKKMNMNFLDDQIVNYQTIVFHFTMVNGTEPENSEQIFKEIFPNIHLNTLRLLGKPSTVGVNYQTETGSHFVAGPTYIIIMLQKFGGKIEE
ncbi:PCNA-interacting partner [Dirofilaria immitis]